MNRSLIIYDGECGFCNSAILYLATKDTSNSFIFVSNLSKIGKEYLHNNDLTEITKKTIILVKENKYYTKGKALKIISKQLSINNALLFFINITNEKIVDFLYNIVANNRLLLSKNNCKIPSKDIRSKFIIS